ncbi:MAG: TonB-dependent receptor [Candidatus Eisenbacteria bacterium]|nr:TonB-dependent receptor [Candidatus Eisenbacteria bacterium]
MSDDGRAAGKDRTGASRQARFTTREIALLGLMAALWGIIEITVGGMIKGWHIPFGGALLSTFGVVILMTARGSVPRRWSSLLVGIVAAGIRFASGFGGAVFAAIGILAESLIVELVLSLSPRPRQRVRILAGALAVLWALVHPFVVQGFLAGLGPAKVYAFTVGFIVGHEPVASGQAILVFCFLVVVHIALGVSAVLFVDRIILAPYMRARRSAMADEGAESVRRSDDGSKRVVAILLAVALLLAPGVRDACAQQSESSRLAAGAGPGGSYWLLPEFTVIGTRLLGPYSVTELDSDEVLDSGAEDLSRALDLVPGMVIRTNSRGEAKLSTRGLPEREIVVLVDGVPISDPYTGSVNSEMILSGAISRISVTKGPAASVYGANALGGIVEVSTAVEERTGLGYLLSAGDDGRYSGHVSGAGRIGLVHLSGGIAANGRDGFTLPASFTAEKWEDGGDRDYSAKEDILAWGRAAWDVGPRTSASLSVQLADGRRDVPASTVAERPRFWSFPFWRESRTIGSLAWRPSDALDFESRVFYGTNDNQLAAYFDFDRTKRRWLSSVSNRVYGGYVYSEFTGIEGQRVCGGVNVKVDKASLQSDLGEQWTNHEATTMAAFAQDIIDIGENSRVALAANTDMMSGEGMSLVRFNPQASWSRRLGGGYAVRVLGGMKTRFPTLKEWFSPEIGNPDLKPETSKSMEVEVTRRTGRSMLSLLVFEQWVNDMIVSAGSGDPCRNVGSATTWGAEAGVRRNLATGLDLDLSVTMTSARDDATGEWVPLVPRTVVTAAATYERGRATYMARATRVGSRSMDDGHGLSPYALMDLRAVYSTAWGDLFAGVENVFDVLYEDEDGFPQPGRGFELGIMRELYR